MNDQPCADEQRRVRKALNSPSQLGHVKLERELQELFIVRVEVIVLVVPNDVPELSKPIGCDPWDVGMKANRPGQLKKPLPQSRVRGVPAALLAIGSRNEPLKTLRNVLQNGLDRFKHHVLVP